MLSFFAGTFAVAGAVAAAGPLIIHLLNRRRYRVISWAAMDFLRQAIERNRRILDLRDWLLLALRTLCVLLFGLAMARPYFTRQSGSVEPNQPVHAVLVVDNSLSMGYETLSGTLLDQARAKAAEFISQLPPGSRISVLPWCGAADEFSWDPYRTKEDAQQALDRLTVVDRTAHARQAIDLALEACQRAPELPSKRVVLLGDQQTLNWPSGSLEEQAARLPELQIVEIARPETENTYLADFRLQDAIADVETTATFLATVRHEGSTPRSHVQVTLEIDGVAAASKVIDLEPGQSAEVVFPHRFEVQTEPGQASFAVAQVSLSPDRLPADDRRVAVVPVVASLPVVFIDSYGANELPRQGKYGETFLLRRLLAPVTVRGEAGRQLIQIRHITPDQLRPELLHDARLVVMAGVSRPDPAALAVLTDFVRQGGPLVLAAGGSFDSAGWTEAAWQNGAGLLPAPLAATPLGRLPQEAGQQLQAFQLDVATLQHDYFQIENEPPEVLEDLYGVPVFFKAVSADLSDSTLDALSEQLRRQLTADQAALAEYRRQQTLWQQAEARGELTESDRLARDAAAAAQQQRFPRWLHWGGNLEEWTALQVPDTAVPQLLPRSLGAYTNQAPFLVERTLGLGRVLLVTSGVAVASGSQSSGWNNLAATDAVLVYDRIFRTLLGRTFPVRNLESVERIVVPVLPGDRRDRFELTRPDDTQEPLPLDALGADRYGLTVRHVAQRGIYRVTAFLPESAALEGTSARHWEAPYAVNGPADESNLRPIDAASLSQRLGEANYRWIAPDQAISLAGAHVAGQDLWRWCLAAVLLCLLAELLVLARTMRSREAAV